MRLYPLLARMKPLRGTPFDPFGYTAERRMERALIRQYQCRHGRVPAKRPPQTMDALIALAELPLTIRGFGPVKEANARRRQQTARGPDRPSACGWGAGHAAENAPQRGIDRAALHPAA
jgi:hypothetical protein